MKSQIQSGYVLGTASTVIVQCGFVPDYVEVINLKDQDVIFKWTRGRLMAFTSGGATGANTVAAGSKITGNTSKATATIRQVLLVSGTFAAGNAAGWFIFNEDDSTGTFQSETVYISSGTNVTSPVGTNDATVILDVEETTKIDTATAASNTTGITAYQGTAGANAKGFNIGATVSETGDILWWKAELHGRPLFT